MFGIVEDAHETDHIIVVFGSDGEVDRLELVIDIVGGLILREDGRSARRIGAVEGVLFSEGHALHFDQSGIVVGIVGNDVGSSDDHGFDGRAGDTLGRVGFRRQFFLSFIDFHRTGDASADHVTVLVGVGDDRGGFVVDQQASGFVLDVDVTTVAIDEGDIAGDRCDFFTGGIVGGLEGSDVVEGDNGRGSLKNSPDFGVGRDVESIGELGGQRRVQSVHPFHENPASIFGFHRGEGDLRVGFETVCTGCGHHVVGATGSGCLIGKYIHLQRKGGVGLLVEFGHEGGVIRDGEGVGVHCGNGFTGAIHPFIEDPCRIGGGGGDRHLGAAFIVALVVGGTRDGEFDRSSGGICGYIKCEVIRLGSDHPAVDADRLLVGGGVVAGKELVVIVEAHVLLSDIGLGSQ